MPSMSFFKAVNDTIMIGVHDRDFKGGAFKPLIPRPTDTVRALNIFLGSPLLSTSEKQHIRRFLSQFLVISARFMGGAEPRFMDIIGVGMDMESLASIFDDDTRARGGYVPPLMLQTLNADNSVRESHVWDDATQTGTTVQGGVSGVPPGAPSGFAGGRYGLLIDGTVPGRPTVTPISHPPTQTENTKQSEDKEKESKKDKPKGEHPQPNPPLQDIDSSTHYGAVSPRAPSAGDSLHFHFRL